MVVDMLEKLPTPYGLVRNGVAPDHPEVKQVQYDFDKVLFGTERETTDRLDDGSGDYDGTTAEEDNRNHSESLSGGGLINFYGNVHVGVDVTLDELRQLYDVVVLAYGCESDQTLNIPGSGGGGSSGGDTTPPPLEGILSAREFVAWYNGHADFAHVGDIVQRALERGGGKDTHHNHNHNHIVVIGQGNVALDCARILAKTRHALEDTDIATRALDILHNNNNKSQCRRTISIIGRRGHVQGAFTIKELRELTKLDEEGTGCPLMVRTDELNLGATAASLEELKAHRPKQRMDKLLRQHAAISTTTTTTPTESKKTNEEEDSSVQLRFLLNPIEFQPAEHEDKDDRRFLGRVLCERTKLEGDMGHQKAVGTGELESIEAHLVRFSLFLG
jgi:adrenodoxin-NADP+ reductase